MLYIMFMLEIIFMIGSFGLLGGLTGEEKNIVRLSIIFIELLMVVYYFLLYKKAPLAKILLVIDCVAVFAGSIIVMYGDAERIGIVVANICLLTLSIFLFRSVGESAKILFVSTTVFMSAILYYILIATYNN